MERYSDQWKRKYQKKRAKHKKVIYGVGAVGLLTLSIFLCVSQGGSSRVGADAAIPNQIEQDIAKKSNLGPLEQDTTEKSIVDPLQQEPTSLENLDFSSKGEKEVHKDVQSKGQEVEGSSPTSESSETESENSQALEPTDNKKENTSSLETESESNESSKNNQGEESSEREEDSKSQETKEDSELEEEFFKDTIFIGDSRSEGLGDFGKVKGAEFYTYRGLMVNTAIAKNYIELKNGNKGNVLDAAKQTSFSKVYLLFGINELGWKSLDIFKENYRSIIEGLREIEPDCEIFIQANYPVTKKMDLGDKVYNNTNIRKFNQVIKELAEEEEVSYIDLYSYFADQEGNLPEKSTPDGIHLNVSYFKDWKQCLMDFGDGNTER